MDMHPGFLIAAMLAAGAVATVLTWLITRWWFGRKLQAAAYRLHKSDQGRLFANQQNLQARTQIETLKKELGARLAGVVVIPAVGEQRDQFELIVAAHAVEPSRPRLLGLEPARSEPTPSSAFGFADTQLMA